jgi:hypothetical protein
MVGGHFSRAPLRHQVRHHDRDSLYTMLSHTMLSDDDSSSESFDYEAARIIALDDQKASFLEERAHKRAAVGGWRVVLEYDAALTSLIRCMTWRNSN